MSGPLTFAWRVLVWMVLLAAIALLLVAVLIPRVAGASPYAVLGRSMEPALAQGSLVIARPVDPMSIRTGDVITYQLEPGRPTVVTHRVVQQGIDADGKPVFRTQGDANDIPDKAWVQAVQVRGEQWYVLPDLGYLNRWLSGGVREWGVLAAGGGLALYAAYMFVSVAGDRIRAKGKDQEVPG